MCSAPRISCIDKKPINIADWRRCKTCRLLCALFQHFKGRGDVHIPLIHLFILTADNHNGGIIPEGDFFAFSSAMNMPDIIEVMLRQIITATA